MSDAIADYAARACGSVAELVHLQALARPDHPALICEDETITYAALDALADRVAARLQADRAGGVVAICADSSIWYVAVFLGTLRSGAAIAPLSASATPEQLSAMLGDSGATHLFADAGVARLLEVVAGDIAAVRVALIDGAGGARFEDWLAPEGARPIPVPIDPARAFNLLYSSGTTGKPKGIVQSYTMRWPHNHLGDPPGLGRDAVTMISTPLYSNTTLVSLLPTLAGGGTAVLMPRFDARRFLELSENTRATHAMLVPVQYRRILDMADFDRFDLSSYRMKYATSAPFAAELKAEVLRRWPGGLIEYYGMTEGGGSCALLAHQHPDKLATVGRPMPGHDVRVIDEAGVELPHSDVGELVGRSAAMMTGYHRQPGQTAAAEWTSPAGERFIRTGDLGRIDADGFVSLIGRKKDMIISGGINIYPVDLEALLLDHPAVREAAVVGAPSAAWGETPVGFVTLSDAADAAALRDWTNARLGKMQRLSDLRVVDELPRNAIGKVMKRELQDRLATEEVLA